MWIRCDGKKNMHWLFTLVLLNRGKYFEAKSISKDTSGQVLSTNPVFRREILIFSSKVGVPHGESFSFFKQGALFFSTARRPVYCGGQGWDGQWRKIKGRTFNESVSSHQRRKASEDNSDLSTEEVVYFHSHIEKLVYEQSKKKIIVIHICIYKHVSTYDLFWKAIAWLKYGTNGDNFLFFMAETQKYLEVALTKQFMK